MSVGKFASLQKDCTKEELFQHIEVAKAVAGHLIGESFYLEFRIKVNDKPSKRGGKKE